MWICNCKKLGQVYHNSNIEVALVRETNDDLCIKYGLSVVETDKSNKEDEIAESRIANYNRNSGKIELIKKDIDEAIENAVKYQDFVDELGYKGYFVKKSVHFLYVLGKLPPKIHYEERTSEYYKEIDKFNKLCDELSLISSKDLKSIEDTQNLRTQYLEEVSPLKAQKEIYMKLYNKTDNVADKTILKARINILNEDIERINKKIQTCRRIISKAEKGEKEEWIIQKRFQDNKERREKENAKNKDRKKLR